MRPRANPETATPQVARLTRVSLLRDFGRFPKLLHDPIVLAPVHDPLHLENDVLPARRDSEAGWLGAQILVLQQRHLDPLRTVRISALADPLGGQRPG